MAVTPAQMISAIEAALLANPTGVVSISYPDGRSINYDRNQALSELAYWERKQTQASSGGLSMTQMKLKGDA